MVGGKEIKVHASNCIATKEAFPFVIEFPLYTFSTSTQDEFDHTRVLCCRKNKKENSVLANLLKPRRRIFEVDFTEKRKWLKRVGFIYTTHFTYIKFLIIIINQQKMAYFREKICGTRK